MLAIKLKRIGKKHQASFRVIVAEKRSKLQGRFVEDLGWFNPRSDEFNLDKERAAHWLKVGAAPTASVHNLLIKNGVIQGKKISVHKKSKVEKIESEDKPQEATAVAKSVPEATA